MKQKYSTNEKINNLSMNDLKMKTVLIDLFEMGNVIIRFLNQL